MELALAVLCLLATILFILAIAEPNDLKRIKIFSGSILVWMLVLVALLPPGTTLCSLLPTWEAFFRPYGKLERKTLRALAALPAWKVFFFEPFGIFQRLLLSISATTYATIQIEAFSRRMRLPWVLNLVAFYLPIPVFFGSWTFLAACSSPGVVLDTVLWLEKTVLPILDRWDPFPISLATCLFFGLFPKPAIWIHTFTLSTLCTLCLALGLGVKIFGAVLQALWVGFKAGCVATRLSFAEGMGDIAGELRGYADQMPALLPVPLRTPEQNRLAEEYVAELLKTARTPSPSSTKTKDRRVHFTSSGADSSRPRLRAGTPPSSRFVDRGDTEWLSVYRGAMSLLPEEAVVENNEWWDDLAEFEDARTQ